MTHSFIYPNKRTALLYKSEKRIIIGRKHPLIPSLVGPDIRNCAETIRCRDYLVKPPHTDTRAKFHLHIQVQMDHEYGTQQHQHH